MAPPRTPLFEAPVAPGWESSVSSGQLWRGLGIDRRAAPWGSWPEFFVEREAPAKPGACRQPVRAATSLAAYVDLVRRADRALEACGTRDIEDRLHALSGIYYGAPWSLDFDVEKSVARNVAFQVFLAKTYSSSDDPQPCLGCGLFLSLKRSQDVAGVDMGHVLIGLNARMRFIPRTITIPGTSSTGLEITTWVGDLGGATARLAMDRVRAPSTGASRYFSGTDYGAPSNLEGDVAAYMVASGSSSSLSAPTFPAGTSIPDAMKRFFIDGIGRSDRCQRFLAMHGGTFSGGKLTNRGTVQALMVAKFQSFGADYMANFVLQHNLPATLLASARPLLPAAATDVAKLFIDKLERCRL